MNDDEQQGQSVHEVALAAAYYLATPADLECPLCGAFEGHRHGCQGKPPTCGVCRVWDRPEPACEEHGKRKRKRRTKARAA